MYPKTFYHLGDAQCHHLSLYFTHTTSHVFLQFDCWQLSHLQLQLLLAETEHTEGRGVWRVGMVIVGMSSSCYERGIHVIGCYEVTYNVCIQCVDKKSGQPGVN